MASTAHGSMPMAMRHMDAPRLFAGILGAVFTLLGIAGFFVTGFDDFASHNGESLLGFHVNPLHNLVHLGIGLVGLAMAWRGMARTFGWFLFIAYGATFIYGLFVVDNNDSSNFLALNDADNVLHLVLAALGLLLALWPARSSRASELTE